MGKHPTKSTDDVIDEIKIFITLVEKKHQEKE
jgi:hypothetical protein